MLHPDLNLEALAQDYQIDQRLRIENVLDPVLAEKMAQHLAGNVAYKNMLTLNGNNGALTDEQLAQLSPEDRTALQQSMVQEARAGRGFNYNGFQIKDDSDPVLKDFLMGLNDQEVMQAIAKISGSTALTHSDGQATRYMPGHFLTRHRDQVQAEKRKLAYVFSFCREWHPDWGGLLQFYHEDGAPREAWAPGFNTLSLFDVTHVHAVTYVTPFAGAARLSVTGWFHQGLPEHLA